jgi:xylan 1,4-beta-xylosidase
VPSVEVPAPAGAAHIPGPARIDYAFEGPALPLDFQWLRTPAPERIFSLTARPGHLRLFARESIGSWFEQALVARRQEHFSFRAETRVEFRPGTFQQAAGLTHYYNRHKFHFLAVTHDERHGRVLTIVSCLGDWPDGRLAFPLAEPITLPAEGPVELAMEVREAALQFHWRPNGGQYRGSRHRGSQPEDWRPVGPVLDASLISDEAGRGEHGSFTGAFVGMAAFDISGSGRPADFDRFSYAAEPHRNA